jgi:hypothetical protein
VQHRDSAQELATMTDRCDSEADQIVRRQLRQNLNINVVVEKCALVLLQPEPAEPGRNIHSFLTPSVQP